MKLDLTICQCCDSWLETSGAVILFICFLEQKLCHRSESQRQNQRRGKSITASSSASETSRVQVHLWEGDKRRTKEASGPSNFQASGGQGGELPVISTDMQTPAQNRPLSPLKMASSAFMHNQASISDWWPTRQVEGKPLQSGAVEPQPHPWVRGFL